MKVKSSKFKLFTLLLLTLTTLIYVIYSSSDVDDKVKNAAIAKNGVIDLRNWDFNSNGMIKLDGQWEYYSNELLTPKDLASASLQKKYSTVPGTFGGFGYGTYRLKILVPNDDILYSVKIDFIQNAFKLWAGNKQIASVGIVGKSKNEMKPQLLPQTASFYSENGEVYLLLQVSNFYTKFGFIDTIVMGKAETINTYREKKLAFDLFLLGSTVIAAIYNLAVYLRRRKDKAPLYFALVCIIVSVRTLFLGERFFISLFPGFDYIISGKIRIWTFYLYIPFIVLFVNRNYGEILSKRLVAVSKISAYLYAILVLLSPSKYYIQLIVPFEIIALMNLLYMMWKISKVYIAENTSDYLTVVGLFALFITRVNDILYEYSIIITNSFAPLGIFIFIIANYYVLAERQSKTLTKSEELSEKFKSLNNLKDDFLATTSHELKTPLNGIIGVAENLSENSSSFLSGDEKDSLFLISSSARRLSNMVDDIILFSRLKNNEIKLNKKPVKINKLLEMVIKFSEPSIKNKDLNLVNLIDSRIPYIYGDEDRIQQIFYNLLGNAIKFTQQGEIVISYEIKEGFIEISIKDTGIGIPEDMLGRIFNIYEQVEGITENYGGTGLGLYITKNLINLHGGEIKVNSIVNRGTKFTFTFKLCSEDEFCIFDLQNSGVKDASEYTGSLVEDSIKEQVDDTGGKGHRNYKILIVDDEYINQKVLEDYISPISKNILKASTGKQALQIVKENRDLDLVIVDMMIPDLMGYEICSIIRENYSLFELPILMMTASSRPENLVVSFECGANDYLRKPFGKQELTSRINTLLTLKYSVSEALLLVHQVAMANEKIESLSAKNSESTRKVEELIEYNKIKTEFFANISHELRTPLNVLSSTIQLLKSLDERRNLGDERIKYYFDIMNQNVYRLLRLITNLIDTTKLDGNYLTLSLAKGNIVYVIEELVQSVADFVDSKGISMIFDTEIEEKILAFDEEKIERILFNLLSNAIKFTEKEGSIYVNIYDRKEYIEISVRDTGIGIPEDKLDFIFERFAQVDKSTTRNKEGSGIGLSLVKSLVEMHGGFVYAKSKLGEGSEFIFTIPVGKFNDEEVEDSLVNNEFSHAKHEERLQVEFSDIYL